MGLAHNQRLQRLVGGAAERLFLNSISRAQTFLLGCHKEHDAVQLLRRVRRERVSLQTAYEAYMVYSIAKAYSQQPGEIAEVGVFQGASARMICEVKGDKPLHLFDTFEGLPTAASQDGKVHAPKQYPCSLESVRAYLNDYPNVHFYKGEFPATTVDLKETKFCFVHLDVDLYASTLSCLKYFYPRMTPGGVILSHDYSILAGVKQAFEEFLADKPERPIELPSTQCMLIKL
jgi:hypothetical protein